MPNRALHIAVSTPTGACFSFYNSQYQNHFVRFEEACGGFVGGVVGGSLPDFIDPPTWPGHRSVGHGLIPVAMAGVVWQQRLDAAQNHLRRSADAYHWQAAQCQDPIPNVWYSLMETACRLLAGFLAGIFAGYLSHVALDFATPGCLPLVC
jgi:hypothetical protein